MLHDVTMCYLTVQLNFVFCFFSYTIQKDRLINIVALLHTLGADVMKSVGAGLTSFLHLSSFIWCVSVCVCVFIEESWCVAFEVFIRV